MLDSEVFVSPQTCIRDVMKQLDHNRRGIVLIVNEFQQLLGTITDGDIRRAILTGIDLKSNAQALLERRSSTPYPEPITAPVGTPDVDLIQLMNENSIRQIPLLDEEGHVVDLALLGDLIKEYELSLTAVVMAGGFGTRLRPLTEELPKPMLPVGNQPLMELMIRRLRESGIQRVNVTTHYLPEKITEHFGDGSEFGVEIDYVAEDQPLGTAGSLGLMPSSEEPLLVINGDILTGVDFRAMLAHHRKHHADLTVGIRQHEYQVPYGVIDCEGPYIRGVREKPVLKFWFNAGIYLLEPSVRHYIPTTGQRFDMTDLIHTLLADDRRVINFPIMEYWLDIGQPEDYDKAQEDVKNGRFVP
jgi:dTDP-glucose pyrophosphorylase/CBS domain-containing protein